MLLEPEALFKEKDYRILSEVYANNAEKAFHFTNIYLIKYYMYFLMEKLNIALRHVTNNRKHYPKRIRID